MRFSRLTSDVLSLRATGGCAAVRVGVGSSRDFIARILDRTFERRQPGALRQESDNGEKSSEKEKRPFFGYQPP